MSDTIAIPADPNCGNCGGDGCWSNDPNDPAIYPDLIRVPCGSPEPTAPSAEAIIMGICGDRGFAGPTCCILPLGHDGKHGYGEPPPKEFRKWAAPLRERIAELEAVRDGEVRVVECRWCWWGDGLRDGKHYGHDGAFLANCITVENSTRRIEKERLEIEIHRIEKKHDKNRTKVETLTRQNKKIEAESATLRAALKRYGDHTKSCHYETPSGCCCGFVEACTDIPSV